MIIENAAEGIAYISIVGELDDGTAPEIRQKLDEIIDKSKTKKVVFDLSKLDFMDSTGIGVLLGRYKKLLNKQISAFITKPNTTVDKILSLSGIYKLMPKI